MDPGEPGRFSTVPGEYRLPGVKLPDYLEKVEQAWPCPAGTKSIPSYRGYLRAQRLLASQGYLTVSIAANGIAERAGRLPRPGPLADPRHPAAGSHPVRPRPGGRRANHNYFNSEWTPGLAAAPSFDDWFDPEDAVCGTGRSSLRLTPVQQQQVGEPDRYAVDLAWSAPGGPGAELKPRRPLSPARSSAVAARIIVPPNSTGTAFDLAVADAAGHRATLGRVTLNGLPGTESTVGDWGQEVRVPPAAGRGAGLDRVVEGRPSDVVADVTGTVTDAP